jgi:hypothetical protein
MWLTLKVGEEMMSPGMNGPHKLKSNSSLELQEPGPANTGIHAGILDF